MLSGMTILILSQNTLEAAGLKAILQEFFSPQRVRISELVAVGPHDHEADYVFTTPEIFAVHQTQLPARRRVVILTRGEGTGPAQEGPPVVDVTLPQAQIVDRLEEIFRRDERPAGTGDREDLTVREMDVLRLVARGFINKQIADKLSISLHTVISHRKNITRKLGIRTVSGLTMYALLNGLISSKDIR